MSKCEYCKDEICVNTDCPMVADYCPVYYTPDVCKWEKKGAYREGRAADQEGGVGER